MDKERMAREKIAAAKKQQLIVEKT